MVNFGLLFIMGGVVLIRNLLDIVLLYNFEKELLIIIFIYEKKRNIWFLNINFNSICFIVGFNGCIDLFWFW